MSTPGSSAVASSNGGPLFESNYGQMDLWNSANINTIVEQLMMRKKQMNQHEAYQESRESDALIERTGRDGELDAELKAFQTKFKADDAGNTCLGNTNGWDKDKDHKELVKLKAELEDAGFLEKGSADDQAFGSATTKDLLTKVEGQVSSDHELSNNQASNVTVKLQQAINDTQTDDTEISNVKKTDSSEKMTVARNTGGG